MNVIQISCEINTEHSGYLKRKTTADKYTSNVQNFNNVVKPLRRNNKEVSVAVTSIYLFLSSVSFSGLPFLGRKLIKKEEVNV